MSPRIIIGTPCRGAEVGKKYHTTIIRLLQTPGIECELGWLMWDGDIVRIRNRMAREAIARQADYLFLVDSDVSFDPRLLGALVAQDVDLVGAPYARKRIYWDRLHTAHAQTEQDFYDWPIKEGDAVMVKPDLVRVHGLPMGCTLIRVSALERMTEHYGQAEHGLTYTDEAHEGNTGLRTVSLFNLIIEGGALLSEDYSFSHRSISLHIHPHLYLGPYSPADHTGVYCWHGWRPT